MKRKLVAHLIVLSHNAKKAISLHCSIIGRRAQKPRQNIDLDEIIQVLRDSGSDNLIAERMFCT